MHRFIPAAVIATAALVAGSSGAFAQAAAPPSVVSASDC